MNYSKAALRIWERLIDKLSGQYAEINDKSFKKLDGKIQRIEDHKKGHLAD